MSLAPLAVTLEPPLRSLAGQRCPRSPLSLPHVNPPACPAPPPRGPQAIHSALRLDRGSPAAWTQAIHSALRLDRGRAAGVSAFRELAQVSRACLSAFRPAEEKSRAGDTSPRPALQGPV